MSNKKANDKTSNLKNKGENNMTPELGTKEFDAKKSFKESLDEMKEHRAGRKKLSTWDEFLDELEQDEK